MNSTDEPSRPGEGPSPSSATSRSLLDRVRADDESAWRRLVVLYGPLVLRWCRRRDLQEQDIADIFQDVFQAVATHVAAFRKERDGDTFRGWLRTITRNKVLDHLRRTGREPGGAGGTDAQLRFSELPAAHFSDEDDPGEGQAVCGLLGRALELIREEFEERTWRAFWLTAVEGRDSGEVAAELGMSRGAVRVAKSRVLRRFREELGGAIG